MAKFSSRFSSLLGGSNKTENSTASENNTSTAAAPASNQNVPDFQIVAGTLKKYNGSAEEVIIPADMGIKTIGQRAFFKCSSIKSVKLPSGITTISNYAFSTCENLTYITIPSTVNSIGNYVFENCKSLKSIVLPNELSSVGNYLFSGCKNLESVTLPDCLRTVSNYMFYKCETLNFVVIPEKVAGIGWKAFSGCTSLSNIEFPKRLNTIGNYAFENCTALEKLSLSSNVTNIGEGVFFLCENLKEIDLDNSNSSLDLIDGILYNTEKTLLYVYPSKLKMDKKFDIPEGVKTICYGAFSNCSELEEINIPTSVTSIENYAFFNCSSLSKLIIPESVNNIGKNAFHKCENLIEVVIPQNTDKIESGSFSGCEKLEKVNMPTALLNIGEIAFFGCYNLKNFEFPDDVTTIGRAAFSNCNSLTHVNIHASINTIDKAVFSHCESLEAINVDDGNTEFCSLEGALYNKQVNYLYVYPAAKTDEEYTLPSSVSRILDQAFYGARKLKRLTIPSNVNNIGISAVSDCAELETVVIENGLANIGTFCFSKCPKLNLMYLPESVTYIDVTAFAESPEIRIAAQPGTFAYNYANENNIPIYIEEIIPEPEPEPEPVIESEPVVELEETAENVYENYNEPAIAPAFEDNTPVQEELIAENTSVSIPGFKAPEQAVERPTLKNVSRPTLNKTYGNIQRPTLNRANANIQRPTLNKADNSVQRPTLNNINIQTLNQDIYVDNDNSNINLTANSETVSEPKAANTVARPSLNGGNIARPKLNRPTVNPSARPVVNKNRGNAPMSFDQFYDPSIAAANNAKKNKKTFADRFKSMVMLDEDEQTSVSSVHNNSSYNSKKALSGFSAAIENEKLNVASDSDNNYDSTENNNYYENNELISNEPIDESVNNSLQEDVQEEMNENNIDVSKDNEIPASSSDTLSIKFDSPVTKAKINKPSIVQPKYEEDTVKASNVLNTKLYSDRIKTTNGSNTLKRITNLTYSPNTANSILLTWDEFEAASEYHLLKFNKELKEFEDISRLKSNKALITGMIPGIDEEYKIMAYQLDDNERIPCASSKAIKVGITLPPLTGLKCTEVTTRSITLSWDELKDALKYLVYSYQASERKFLPIEESMKNSVTIYGLRGGTTLRLKVAALKNINRKECMTSLSEEISVTTDMSPVSGVIMASHTSTSIKLNWISINGVNEYRVYIYNPNTDNYEFLSSTRENFIMFENLTPNSEYKYRIRACKIVDGEEILGPPSSVIKADTFV